MWHYDSDRNVCSQFVYGGCLGNANRFEKIEDCQAQCVVDDKGCKYFFFLFPLTKVILIFILYELIIKLHVISQLNLAAVVDRLKDGLMIKNKIHVFHLITVDVRVIKIISQLLELVSIIVRNLALERVSLIFIICNFNFC